MQDSKQYPDEKKLWLVFKKEGEFDCCPTDCGMERGEENRRLMANLWRKQKVAPGFFKRSWYDERSRDYQSCCDIFPRSTISLWNPVVLESICNHTRAK